MTDILTAIVRPADREEIASVEADGRGTLEALREWPVETVKDEEDAAEILREIKRKAKDVDAKRTAITGPLNTAKRAVDDLFRPALDLLREAEAVLKGKITASMAARAEANRKALEAAAAASTPAQASAALASVQAGGAPPGVMTRWSWDVEVTDPTAIPRSFLTLDYHKVNEHLHNHPEAPPEVPGLRFFRKATLAVKT